METIKLLFKTKNKKLINKEFDIISKYKMGYNILTLAKQYYTSESCIRNILVRNNIKLRSKKESRNTEIYKINFTKVRTKIKDPLVINRIIEDYNSGKSSNEIGVEHKVSGKSITNLLKKNNIKLRTNTEAQNHPHTKQIVIESNIKKFGVKNPMQHPKIFEKSNLNRYKYKSCIINEITFDKLQGYEENGIRYLLKHYPDITIHDIKAGRCKDIPNIKYFYDIERIYFPDIYIPKLNFLIEIKCKYTFNFDIEMNLSKQKACINAGYKHLFIVFSNDGKTHLFNV